MLKVLCIVQNVVPSTEISIIRPFSYLERLGEISWQLITEASFRPDLLVQVDIAVFHRNCHPGCREILNTVRAANIPVVYEIDDNFFELPENLPVGRYMRNPNVVQTIEYLLGSANIVKIGSPELGELISKYNSNIIHHPYAVDLNLLNNLTPVKNNRFTIGYAGTVNHQPDLEFLSGPVLRIAKEFPQVCWEFIGCLPVGLKALPQFVYTPFIADYATFLQFLFRRDWRIGLCPILDLPHNRCKTDNKLREYGACHIPGIFSKIPPYSLVVKHGETGILAENTGEAWYEAIKSLICNEALRAKIADQVQRWVEKERSIPVVAQLWLDLLYGLYSKGPGNE
jgi:glycosyltransferase involved in cell wall biosynthesis